MTKQNRSDQDYRIDLDSLFVVEHQKKGVNRCSNCAAWEDKPHPLRGMMVQLKEINTEVGSEVLCQVCAIKGQITLPERHRDSKKGLLKYFTKKR